MKRVLILSALVLVMMGWSVVGQAGSKSDKGDTDATEIAVLCGDCGEIKGGDACCDADAVKCGGCGLIKGSPGCCKIEPGKDAPLCSGCGEIYESEKCCDPDAVKCGDCGLAKGSPGCCNPAIKTSEKAKCSSSCCGKG
ncbi:MAG: hypothetical protein GY835_25495 [bacterium]|nr:hypothetical protein [bacterium]